MIEVRSKRSKIVLQIILLLMTIPYVLPLIQGTPNLPLENGLPRFAKLKRILAK